MAHSPEEIAKHIKTYLIVGATLLVFTAITVGLSFVDFGSQSMNMTIGLAVAAFKSSLVILIFMHLNNERPLIYKVLVFTMVFLGVMFILFIASHDDRLVMKGYEAVFGKH
jgi:cytochrome c oxidase subunit 4